MPKKKYASVHDAFVPETEAVFGAFGLDGPAFDGIVLPVLTYAGSDIKYRVRFDDREMHLSTSVEIAHGGKRLTADIDQLAQAAGLAPANQVSSSAHRIHGLQKSLQSQADYVKRLHRRLVSPEGVALMRAAGAREWDLR